MSILLPTGMKWDLKFERSLGRDAGPFTGGGNKWVWHTVESPWVFVDTAVAILHAKAAAPHFVIGKRQQDGPIVVVQMVSLDRAGRTLGNDSGDLHDTNRADCIQVEICGRAAESGDWPVNRYQALANLVRLANIAAPDGREVPRRLARRFADDRVFSDAEFVRVDGHLGHKHAPDNIHGHTDPGEGFRGQFLMELLEDIPPGGYQL
jgi:hypothetical protein